MYTENTKRELLMLALKAVVNAKGDSISEHGLSVLIKNGWNPLEDSGLAFEIAVALRLSINVFYDTVQPLPWLRIEDQETLWTYISAKEYAKDPSAATRYAIVRAAAAIGQTLN